MFKAVEVLTGPLHPGSRISSEAVGTAAGVR
jgi:hypothetical protein